VAVTETRVRTEAALVAEADLLALPASRFQLAPYELSAALGLEQGLGVSHVMAQVLVRRGLGDPAAAAAFLAPAERHDPNGFAGIDGAVELVRGHLARGSRIVVHGDYDVDGVCATAVLVRALRSLGADPGWYLPSRAEDGYGLSAATVERLADRGTALLITVDCGITAVEEVAHARAAGMDVIITDHHQPRRDGRLPEAPIVHPGVCGYPFAALCGTAVAHKFAEALGASTIAEDVELVALATVADLVPLTGENRRLVREGLAVMAGTGRPGLVALMAVSRTDPSGLDASCLGFRLAPRLNASGRLRRADASLELLLTSDATRAREIARELDQVNLDRRAVEAQIRWEAERLASEMGERPAYVIAARGWHPGVVGIVASRIVERFHRPAVLIALDPDDPMAPGHGSGRSIPGFDLLAALDAGGRELLTYGGHRAAAGLTVAPDRIDAFRELVEAHAASVLTPELLTPRERVDAIASGAELTLDLAEELTQLEPCGLGNPAASLLVPGARFSDVRTMSEGRHARFTVLSGGARAAAVSFGCDGTLPAGGDGSAVDACFRLDRNAWRGVVEPRLVLKSAAEIATRPIAHLDAIADFEYLDLALAEMDRDGDPVVSGGSSESGAAARTVIDRRGVGPLAVIADVMAAASDPDGGCGEASPRVLVVCADSQRRLAGLSGRTGGFALVSHCSLVDEPYLLEAYAHVVVLDPPTSATQDAVLRQGSGFTYLAWGEAEVRFSEQMHELEYGLRASLVALYRSLRERGRASGEELERLLRGDEPQPRPARLAGRLLRVLTELELVSLDPELPTLTLAAAQPTELERSEAFVVYRQFYEEGQRCLRTAQPSR
jgi:single-stranded-DNA-specific exonuclease